jgi:glycyl-tRNA synthetase beta chain
VTDFLLELRSEELPARMQVKAKEDLARLFEGELAKAGLKAAAIETFATPRRLALIAHGLPIETQAVSEETKGPKTSAPPQALEGFLRKTGLTLDQLVDRDGTYFAVIEKAGRATGDVLAEAIPAIVRAFPWPKSMRWGDASLSTESLRWVRPLQGIIALLGDAIVPCEVDGIISGAATMGHRFHSHGPIVISNAGSYVEQLRAAHVIVHLSERRKLIEEGAARVAAAAGLVVVRDEGLVLENAGLIEWPVPMLGRFDPEFLNVPKEVIQLTARVNQKYFVCHDSDGTLANAFVCTANLSPRDGGAAVVAGNEKVLAARLSDAKFFWEQDLKVSLEDQAAKLSNIVFHEKLGSVADKVERVAKLARWLVESGVVGNPPRSRGGGGEADGGGAVQSAVLSKIDGADTPLHRASAVPLPMNGEDLANQAETAARLCKADLVTGMVGEFPELQGIMGGYYARAQGYGDAVADAIRDHYKPVGQGDDVPTAPVTVAVSLADKLDTLMCFFAVDERPTGSKDPYALRRAALGTIRLILENGLRLNLDNTLETIAADVLHSMTDAKLGRALFDNIASGEAGLQWFFADRLKVQQRDIGVRHDLIDAVFKQDDDLVRLLARVKALQAFVGTGEGANLLAGYKRAANILKSSPERGGGGVADGGAGVPQIEAGRGDRPLHHPADGPPPRSGEDYALETALSFAEPLATAAIEREDFEAAMSALASLRAPIDAFFDGVMVNDPDPAVRAYRHGLLARFRDAVHKVADFSKIEG